MKNRFLFFLALLVFTPMLQAQDPASQNESVSIKSELSKAFITIGDPVEYTVTVKHGPDVKVLSSIPPPDQSIFKVKKIEDIREESETTILEGKKFHLTTFRLGEFILDPVKVEYRAGGGDIESIETNRLFLKVKSVSGDEEQTDIRGIKSVLEIPKSALIPSVIIGLLMLIALLPFIWKIFRRRPAIEAPVERVLSAEEEAMLHLNQLYESDLLSKGMIKEYYLEFSEILRIYLERRFRVPAVESTTFEINRALRGRIEDGALKNLIKEVLEFSDLAKFAKFKPEVQDIHEMNQKAKEVIEISKPNQAAGGEDGI